MPALRAFGRATARTRKLNRRTSSRPVGRRQDPCVAAAAHGGCVGSGWGGAGTVTVVADTSGMIDPARPFVDRYAISGTIESRWDAVVYAAEDLALNRPVALTVFGAELCANARFTATFRRAVQAGAALAHPGLLSVADWGHEPVCYLATEPAAGGSLRRMIDAGLRLSPSQGLSVALGAARALAFLHAQGLVHKAVEPANMVFDDRGRLLLANFGIEPALAAAGVSGAAHSGYRAPEEQTDPRVLTASDVYCLALAVNEAVTGIAPQPHGADPQVSPLGSSDALGPLWYALEQAAAPLPEQRPTAAKLVDDLLGMAGLMTRPEPLPLVGTTITPLKAPPTLSDTPQAQGSSGVQAAALPATASLPSPAPAGPLPAAAPTATTGSTVSGSAPSLPEPAAPADMPAPQGPAPATPEPAGPEPAAPAPQDPAVSQPAPSRSSVPLDEPSRGRAPGVVLSVTAVVALVLAGVWIWLSTRDSALAVPDVVGQSQAAAIEAAESAGWRHEVVLVRAEGTSRGEVVRAEAVDSTETDAEPLLRLLVSLGEPLVLVPDELEVYGLTPSDAQGVIEELGLEVSGEAGVNDPAIPEGFTVGLDLPGGVYELEAGSQVGLLISAGPADVSVPEVPASRTVDAALRVLSDAELSPSQVELESAEVAAGEVIAFDPPSGSGVAPGSLVEILISLGPSQVAIPEVVGVSAAEAVQRLEGRGFAVIVDDLGDEQLVGSVSPAEGELVSFGSEVTISADS